MFDTKYTYAVARIRALETGLFTSSVIEQLLACDTEQQCLQIIQEKGWGDADTPLNADAILAREQEKIWETIGELGVDMSVFDVLSYPNLFHNLKAAVKDACTQENGRTMNIYYEDTAVSPDEMLDIIRSKDFSRLPENMAGAARLRLKRSMKQERLPGTVLSGTMLSPLWLLLILRLLCAHRRPQNL